MAEYQRREVQPPTRIEYVLGNPTNWVEYGKACTAAVQELKSYGVAPADDSIWVAGHEDEIVIWFDKPKRGA